MKTPVGPHNIHELLTAYADGELDSAQNLTVIDYLEGHPEGFTYLRDWERLRQAVRKINLEEKQSCEVPAGLRARLQEFAADSGNVESNRPTTRFPPSPLPWSVWLGVLGTAAACLIGGILGGIYWTRTGNVIVQNQAVSPPEIFAPRLTGEEADVRDAKIPARLVLAATHVHVDCSRVAERLHSGGYPVLLGPLSALVKNDLKSSAPEPDLSSIGYHYVGAGPCAHPLEGTVHLLYRKDGPEPRAAVSVFVQKYVGQFNLHVGRMYCIAGPASAFPMCAWRSNDVVYFLIADDVTTALSARQAIPGAPRTGT